MRPLYRIDVDGVNVTSNFSDRALEIDVVDKVGLESDEATIRVDDRDYLVEIPKRGAKMQIWLGYETIGLVYLGSYVIDQIDLEGPPRRVIIRGKAADMKGKLKEQRTEKEGYQNKTVKQVVEEVAKRQGLEAVVKGKIASEKIKRLDQVDESDFHLLTRLAKDYDAFFKIGNGKVLFVGKTEGDVPEITLVESDLISYRFSLKDRAKYGKVKAKWHDKSKGDRVEEEAKGDDPDGATYFLRHQYPDKDRAKAAAEAKLRELRRQEGDMSVEITGDPTMTAGGTCKVILRDGTTGPWHMKTVTHSYSQEGIRTKIAGETKDGDKTGKKK